MDELEYRRVLKSKERQIENLRKMNGILKRLVVSLSKHPTPSEVLKEEEEQKPRLH